MKFFGIVGCGKYTLDQENLISVHILDRLGYSFLFGIGKVKVYRDSLLIDTGVLCGSL